MPKKSVKKCDLECCCHMAVVAALLTSLDNCACSEWHVTQMCVACVGATKMSFRSRIYALMAGIVALVLVLVLVLAGWWMSGRALSATDTAYTEGLKLARAIDNAQRAGQLSAPGAGGEERADSRRRCGAARHALERF